MPGRAGRNRNKDPHRYWNHIASTKPEAQALAARLGLEIPTAGAESGLKSGLMYVPDSSMNRLPILYSS